MFLFPINLTCCVLMDIEALDSGQSTKLGKCQIQKRQMSQKIAEHIVVFTIWHVNIAALN